MLIIDKNNDYLIDRGDYYSIGTINSNDSVIVELDKRLHVDSDIMIAGDLQCDDIVCDGVITVSGNLLTKDMQADSIFLFGIARIEGNVVVNKNIQFGKANVLGTIISHGGLHSISELYVGRNISVATTATFKSSLVVSGDIFVGGMFDAHSKVRCAGEVKIAGVEVKTFGRYNDGEYVAVVTDNVLAVTRNGSSAEIIEDYHEYIENINNDIDHVFKERDEFIINNKHIFDVIASKIKKK